MQDSAPWTQVKFSLNMINTSRYTAKKQSLSLYTVYMYTIKNCFCSHVTSRPSAVYQCVTVIHVLGSSCSMVPNRQHNRMPHTVVRSGMSSSSLYCIDHSLSQFPQQDSCLLDQISFCICPSASCSRFSISGIIKVAFTLCNRVLQLVGATALEQPVVEC